MQARKFLLVGNGLYGNRGCEAIVRGTMRILERTFGPVRVSTGTCALASAVDRQAREETDDRIAHFPLHRVYPRRFTPEWFRHRLLRLVGQSGFVNYQQLAQHADGVDVAMEIGGDNYSLDYGRPLDFMAVDRWIKRRRLPLVLWGASVGPFDADPRFKPVILRHLRTFDLILVRESASQEYLASNGIESNVRFMADPAFVMEPVKPPDEVLAGIDFSAAIGVNLSPLMARYVTGGDLDRWIAMSAKILEGIAAKTGGTIILVPHVAVATDVWADDRTFLRRVIEAAEPKCANNVVLLPELSAAEFKWIIGRCKAFIGARTHSTIAALSSLVPTISLAYSLKARGINQDVYGSLDYCISPRNITPDVVVDRLESALASGAQIAKRLEQTIPKAQEQAFRGGEYLKDLL